MRRLIQLSIVLLVVSVGSPALACGGLIGRNGAVNLLRTTTLAAYHDGNEHYVTAFSFAGGGGEFGSIVPLPGIPSKVERGGNWTLQRLVRETQPQPEFARLGSSAQALSAADVRVVLETRIDALDITVLEGGATAVGLWAKNHGFLLPPDAPEVLEFYASRSPIFMAARFDADEASRRGQGLGDGTPIHLTIPTEDPWVPIRILALGKQPNEIVQADVYVLTDDQPTMLKPKGVELSLTQRASESLLADLRSDEGMDWIPKDMWLSHLTVEAEAGNLTHDLSISATGGVPSRTAAGLPARFFDPAIEAAPWFPASAWVLAVMVAARWWSRRLSGVRV